MMKKWNVVSNYKSDFVGTYAHIEAEPGDGTCYDLVITPDPYGGFLIVWPMSIGQVWRGFKDGEIKTLSKNVNPYSTQAIQKIWWKFVDETMLEEEVE